MATSTGTDSKPCSRRKDDFMLKFSFSYSDEKGRSRCTICKGLTINHVKGKTVHERCESVMPDDFGELHITDEIETTRLLQGHLNVWQKSDHKDQNSLN